MKISSVVMCLEINKEIETKYLLNLSSNSEQAKKYLLEIQSLSILPFKSIDLYANREKKLSIRE